MAAVYSVRFAAIFETLGPDEFVVPAGVAWVIRDVVMFLREDSEATFTASITGSDGQVLHWARSSTADDVLYHAECRQVLEPGESFICVAVQPTDFTVGGYALALP